MPNKKQEGNCTAAGKPDVRNGPLHAAPLGDLLLVSPEVLRARILRISPLKQPERWAEENLKLGAILQQRSQREAGSTRVRTCTEAIEAYEAALCIYCKCNPSNSRCPPGASSPDMTGDTGRAIERVIEFASQPGTSEELYESIDLLQAACGSRTRDAEFGTWALNMINLGCTLVLAGKCEAAHGSAARLDAAIEVFGTLLSDRRLMDMPYERAAAHVNLAEALSSMAEISFPDERVEYLEHALRSLVVALNAVAPVQLRMLLESTVGARA